MTELEVKNYKIFYCPLLYIVKMPLWKNLGIDKETLDKSFKILEDNGYLESYEEFMKRESLNEEGDCCKNKKRIVLVQAVLLALVIHALQVQVAVIIIFLVI